MGSDDDEHPKEILFTTNAEDQAEVAKLQARLAQSKKPNSASGISSLEGAASLDTGGRSKDSGKSKDEADSSSLPAWMSIPSVSIDDGAHKYVLISATEPSPRNQDSAECIRRNFVVSKRGAAYHRNAAEPLIHILEVNGFRNINVEGGGRIYCDDENKKISIFGYSYGFGRANHELSKSVVEADGRYKDYEVTWSNDGC